jgi:hypothetical protein
MEVNPSVPAMTVPELIAYSKTNPGKVSMASAGVGSGSHAAGELFKMMAGVNLVHVPYRGQGPALTDLLGGQVHVYFAGILSSIQYVRAGKLRALAVTTATRSEVLPNIPTGGEFAPGYRGGCLAGYRRAQGHTGRDRLQAQQGDQRCSRGFQTEGEASRPGRHGACELARRLWQADRRRNREVGQGDQVRGRQGRLRRGRRGHSISSVRRMAAMTANGTKLPFVAVKTTSAFWGNVLQNSY